jgi:hypothetical protein
MISFPKKMPPATASWLRRQVAARPTDRLLCALATDERMDDLWSEVDGWPGAEHLVQLAHYYGQPKVLSVLMASPDARIEWGFPQYWLWRAADEFALQLEAWPTQATELWGEPIDALACRIRAFATAAFGKAEAQRSLFDGIPPPKLRGRGNARQRAFRNALSYAVGRLAEGLGALSQTRRDRVIEILTNVAFPDNPVDAETIRRHRQRRGSKAGDNS